MSEIAIRNAVLTERWELIEELKIQIAHCRNQTCTSCIDYTKIINQLMNAKV
jgi:hypothetical protein